MKKLINKQEDSDQLDQNLDQIKIEESLDEGDSNSVEMIQQQQNEMKKTNKWTQKEDDALKKLVQNFGEKNWRKISGMMEGRSAIQCLHRWSKILKPGLVKGPWTTEEDEKLIFWVQLYGPFKWSQCSELITGRSGKQCRERWFNNLNPNVKKGNWTQEEDNAIFKGYLTHGSSWSRIAKNLEGRTENSVKNRFYSTVRKLLSDMEKKGKYLNQDNENDIKNIIQQSLQEYQAAALKSIDEVQDDQQNRKSSLISNSNPVTSFYESNDQIKKRDQGEDSSTHQNDSQYKHELTEINQFQVNLLNMNTHEKSDLIILRENQEQNNENSLIDESSDRKRIVSRSTENNINNVGQQNQKQQFDDNNINSQEQQYNVSQNIDECKQSLPDIYEIQDTTNQDNHNADDNILQQQLSQQNDQVSQSNQQNLMQSALKLKDEYSQQNCLYRLILEGNVSIKKTTSMRDYSLYQKNKAKSRSKKFQREQSDDQKRISQNVEPTSESLRSSEQYNYTNNSHQLLNQQLKIQKENSNNEIVQNEQKIFLQRQQISNSDENHLSEGQIFQNQISQKVNIIPGKNQNKQNKSIVQSSTKGNIQNLNNNNNNNKNNKLDGMSNLSTLLKEKIMSMQQKKNFLQKHRQIENTVSEDIEDSSNQSQSQEENNQSTKKNIKNRKLSSFEKAQQLQKEIEEKKKQLLMLNLETRIEKKKGKSHTQEMNENGNKMIISNDDNKTQNDRINKINKQQINLKEEYQDEHYNQIKGLSDNNQNNRNNQNKMIIDHEYQKKLIQKMLVNSNIQKSQKQNKNKGQESNEEDKNDILQNSKLQQQIKLLNQLQKCQNQEDSGDFNDDESEEDQNESEEENDDEEDDEDDCDEDDDEEEEQDEKVSNKLMKYLSSSVAKLVHSITQKYNKDLIKPKKNQIKNTSKQNQQRQNLQDQIQQQQKSAQSNSQNKQSQVSKLSPSKLNSNKNNSITRQKSNSVSGVHNPYFNDLDIKKKIKKEENQIINEEDEENQTNLLNESQKKNQKNDLYKSQDDKISKKSTKLPELKQIGRQKSLSMYQEQIANQNMSLNKEVIYNENEKERLNDYQQDQALKRSNNKYGKVTSPQLQFQDQKYNQNSELSSSQYIQNNLQTLMEIENQEKSNKSSKKQEIKSKKQDKTIKSQKEQQKDINKINEQKKQEIQVKQNNINEQNNQMKQNDSSKLCNLSKQNSLNQLNSSNLQKQNSQNQQIMSEQLNLNNSVQQEDINQQWLQDQQNPFDMLSQMSLRKNSSSYQQNQIDNSKSSIYHDKLQVQNKNWEGQNISIQNDKQNNPMNEVDLTNGISSSTLSNLYKQNSQNKSTIPIQSIIEQLPQDPSKGDDRIDYLITQLQSLETLLNTTKQELNKLESTIQVPDSNSVSNQQSNIGFPSEAVLQNNLITHEEFQNKLTSSNGNYNDLSNMNYNRHNSYVSNYNYHSIKSSYNQNNTSLHQQLHKSNNNHQNHSKYNQNNLLHNNILQNNFDSSDGSNNNLNNLNMGGGKLNNIDHHISDITSLDFGFDNKYSNDDVQSICQQQEKGIYNLGNISSINKGETYQQKNNHQLMESPQISQDKNIQGLLNNTFDEEINNIQSIQSQNNQLLKHYSSKENINYVQTEQGKINNNKNKNHENPLSPSSNKKSKQTEQDIQSDDMIKTENNNYLQNSSSNLNYTKAKQFQQYQNQNYVKQFVMSNGDSGSYLNDENNSQINLNMSDD